MARLELVVDANPLISGLLGGSAFKIIFSDLFQCVTTEHTTWEVKKYIPMISAQSGVSEESILFAFETFPLTAHQASFYDTFVKHATEQISHRDPKDIDILALTYRLKTPLWTEDLDLQNVQDIQTVSTEKLLKLAREGQ